MSASGTVNASTVDLGGDLQHHQAIQSDLLMPLGRKLAAANIPDTKKKAGGSLHLVE